MARIVVLTGERGLGKSTVCREIIALAQAKKYTCGGLLTLCQSDGARTLLNVRSGDARQLTLGSDEEPAVVHGRFRFDPETLRWANRALVHATPCDLLVVDELGPLEIDQRRGWVNAFYVLRDANFALALAVVRPELVVRAQLELPSCATTVLTVTRENRERLPGVLLEILERQISTQGAPLWRLGGQT